MTVLRLARVLVVEDDETLRALLAAALRDEGYDVATAADGFEAIRETRERPPDLILLDLLMPALDGLSFLDIYRQAPVPKAPILVVTGAPEYGRQVMERVEAVVYKPFSMDRVLDLVRRHLGLDGAWPPDMPRPV